jgi:PAS domain-containing protein
MEESSSFDHEKELLARRLEADRKWGDVVEVGRELVLLWDRDRNTRFGRSRAARALGLSERQLERLLLDRRLPPYHVFDERYLVVRLRDEAEMTSLPKLSYLIGRDPCTLYRFVLRVTRLPWTEIRELPRWQIRERALRVWSTFHVE